ncbi:hypothetical protein TOPH_05013 [Tolypocladium ophioglossoides CBS 100239]|uniref:Uncharacterized protein n=1 Tax=Tolypocladium ophioglossoides (strain CBS 100239) TaxID=1163406 RepID=A0A0L0N8S0_TOLOC|nr:hypothetical protein TOPH_05013 [Tolypocladium ophioglossoides CBS 100239]
MHSANESIREIDGDSWLIADKLLLSRQCLPSPDQPSWSDGNGLFYVLSEATGPRPESRPLSEASELQKVYDTGNVSAVWRVGEAFFKGPLGFDIPKVHFHAEFNGRYYIVTSRSPGQPLSEAWPNVDGPTKQDYLHRLANIYE